VSATIELDRVAVGEARSVELAPLQSKLFTKSEGVSHGITRRVPSVGTAEANISYTAPRDRSEAWRMRQSWCTSMQIDTALLVVPYQVHGNGVAVVRNTDAGTGAAPGSRLIAKADAVVTASSGVALMTTHADCLPMLLYAPNPGVVAAVHAGWRSTVSGVTRNTVRTMTSVYHVQPDDILAFIGPTICHRCYSVGEDVRSAWLALDPDDEAGALLNGGSQVTFNLVSANTKLLLDEGVLPENIETSTFCTKCDGDHWFSHRGQGPYTGRFGAIIALDGRA
jgi:polyphenol oxidase